MKEKQIIFFAICIRLCVLLWAKISDYLIEDYDTSSQNTFLGKWDAVYYLRIASHGYEFELYHAFFPLYPVLIRLFSYIMNSSLVFTGVVISNVCFIWSTVYMYRLSLKMLNDKKLALMATILYCITPASVFMSAIYTESIFALFTLYGLYVHFCKEKTFWNGILSAIAFALATSVRSNGIITIGFYLFEIIQRRNNIFQSILKSGIVLMPYILFQAYGYHRYCMNVPRSPWCHSMIPHLYSYVQKAYWNNGFLKYWTFKQIPNFILASPMIALTALAAYEYVSHFRLDVITTVFNRKESKGKSGYFRLDILVFIYYWIFLSLYMLFMAHVQVITRFLASCPPVYWYAAHICQKHSRFRYWILVYFISYSLIGVLLFNNFYPWT